MTDDPRDLEVRLRWLSTGFVLLFGTALAVGLALHVSRPGSRESAGMLEAGLVLLMAAPAARVVIALLERIRRRDWAFVVMTAVVALELALVMWRAAWKI